MPVLSFVKGLLQPNCTHVLGCVKRQPNHDSLELKILQSRNLPSVGRNKTAQAKRRVGVSGKYERCAGNARSYLRPNGLISDYKAMMWPTQKPEQQ